MTARELMATHQLRRRDWWDWVSVIALLAVVCVFAVDIGVRFAAAETRVRWYCDGENAVYIGAIRGNGVMTVSPYDTHCVTTRTPLGP